MQQHGQNRSGEQIACLMVDIDHFKRFNDEFGHDAGDLVMQYVGQILRETVGPAGTAYRFGGEEFTVLLPGLEEDQAAELADGLRRKIGGATLSHSGRVLGTVSTSIGVAASPQDGSIETLVTRADAALLKAKAAGRNRTVMASEIQARQ